MAKRRALQDNSPQPKKQKPCNSTKFNLTGWLLQNYRVDEGSVIPITKVLDDYLQSGCYEKENISLKDFELGRILKEVFPCVKRFQLRTNGKKAWHYNLAELEDEQSEKKSRESPKSNLQANADTIAKWEDLLKNCTELGWQLSCQDANFSEWVKLDSQELCNGNRVIREIKVFRNWDFVVHVNNRTIAKETLCIPQLKPSRRHVQYLFDVVQKSTVCKGYQVSERRTSKDLYGSVTGETDTWSGRENSDDFLYYHRSLDCRVLLPNDFKRSTRRYCDNCARLKKNFKEPGKKPQNPTTHKRESYMSEDELKEKLHEEKRKRRNAERREQYRSEKINKEMKTFEEDDHNDFLHMFRRVDKESISEDMQLFWEEQEKALSARSPKGYRWHPKVIRMCLSIWNRSPMAYKELSNCGMLVLPSGRLLQLYKNSCSQNPGLNESVGKWMAQEALKRKIGPEGREGGIILDEMAIQEDLQMKSVDGIWKLVGLVSLGNEHSSIQSILKDEETIEVATHVLQFVFLGNNGFRFPFAHFPTTEADPSSLYVNYWKAVAWLRRFGFQCNYCCCDGGQANRSFIKLHFKDRDPVKERFTTINPYTRMPMVFLLDPSHNIKKIRNNLEKSRPGGTRLLRFDNKTIKWAHLYKAYKWDQSSSSLKINERLTEEHFSLGYASRMRNHLAEDVLSKKMLYLLQAYKKHVSQTLGHEAVYLDKTVEFIGMTSRLVETFADTRPVSNLGDHRLATNQEMLQWLDSWDKDVQQHKELSKSDKAKCLLSDKLRFDLSSMIIGFHEVCRIAFNRFPGSTISAFRTNSDLVENIFCQERGHNGQNSNPTYAQYGPTMNSIILGQTTTTTSSNTGSVEKLCFFKNGPLNSRKNQKK